MKIIHKLVASALVTTTIISTPTIAHAQFASLSSSLSSSSSPDDYNEDNIFTGREILDVKPCDLNGYRYSNVVVNVGFGDREYWGYTNSYGQLIGIQAENIILQEKHEELSNGRYCWDEAKVPGTQSSNLDEGHVIADSLGGVSNAYNITPQDSYLNRNGEQAKMEQRIRNAGGAKDFVAKIYYPDNVTQIPSAYSYTFTKNTGETESLFFENER